MKKDFDVCISTNIDKDGNLSFREIQLIEIQYDEDGNNTDEFSISIDTSNIQNLISRLKKLVVKLEKAAGVIKEEIQLENIINTIIEPNIYQEEDSTEQHTINSPVWACKDYNLPCLGCIGCGGIPGSIADDIRRGLTTRAVNNYVRMFGGGRIHADNKIKEWKDELLRKNGTPQPGGLLFED